MINQLYIYEWMISALSYGYWHYHMGIDTFISCLQSPVYGLKIMTSNIAFSR